MSSNVAIDRVLFFGSRMPEEVAKSLPVLRKADKARTRKALEIAVETLKTEGEWTDADTGRDTDALSRIKTMTGELSLGAAAAAAGAAGAKDEVLELAMMTGGIGTLLRAAVRLPTLKQNVLRDDLLSLNLPQDFVADFVKVVDSRHDLPFFLPIFHLLSSPFLSLSLPLYHALVAKPS